MLFEGKTGSRDLGNADTGFVRLNDTGAQAIFQTRLRYGDIAERGKLFSATNTTGIAPGTSIGTTGAFAIWNPEGSGVWAAIQEVSAGWASGTLGAGKLYHVKHEKIVTPPTFATELVPINHKFGGARPNCRVGMTVSGLGAATAMRLAGTITALAADAGTGNMPIEDIVEGVIVIPPGFAWSLQEVGAAGSTPLMFFSATFEEFEPVW